MRVLHIGKFGPPFFGGIENFMMDLDQSCYGQEVSVGAVVHHHQGKHLAFEQQTVNDVQLYRVPCYGQFMFAPVSPKFGVYLNRAIADFKPDVLHIHMPNTSAFFALLYKSARNIPWVVHWHSDVIGDDSPWFLRLFYPLYRPFESQILKRAAKIIVTSPPYLQVSQTLKRFLPKTKVLGLGIKSPEVFSRPSISEGNELNLLMVGRLTYYKGHQVLIEAMARLKLQGLTKVRLSIVGSGELEPVLVKQIESLGLAAQVSLLGRLDDGQLREQFIGADCLCLPSIERTEAYGVVLMEAAAYALPAIVTDVPGSGMSWVVQHDITGLVVKRKNPDALALAIKTLAQQPTKRLGYAMAARARFEQSFNIEQVAKETIQLYRAQLATTKSAGDQA